VQEITSLNLQKGARVKVYQSHIDEDNLHIKIKSHLLMKSTAWTPEKFSAAEH
jgi:hypothetical protein